MRSRDLASLLFMFDFFHLPLVVAYAQHGSGLERPLPEHGDALAVHEDAVLVVARGGKEVALELGEKTERASHEELLVSSQRRGRDVAHEQVVALRLELGVQHLEALAFVGLSDHTRRSRIRACFPVRAEENAGEKRGSEKSAKKVTSSAFPLQRLTGTHLAVVGDVDGSQRALMMQLALVENLAALGAGAVGPVQGPTRVGRADGEISSDRPSSRGARFRAAGR